jgi:hypothetical protein
MISSPFDIMAFVSFCSPAAWPPPSRVHAVACAMLIRGHHTTFSVSTSSYSYRLQTGVSDVSGVRNASNFMVAIKRMHFLNEHCKTFSRWQRVCNSKIDWSFTVIFHELNCKTVNANFGRAFKFCSHGSMALCFPVGASSKHEQVG